MMTTTALLSCEVAISLNKTSYSLFFIHFVNNPLSVLFPLCVAVLFILNLPLRIEL
jgi:hypothetical protein